MFATDRAVASSSSVPCSITRTPYSMQRLTALAGCQWADTYVHRSVVSLTLAWISSYRYWFIQIGSVGEGHATRSYDLEAMGATTQFLAGRLDTTVDAIHYNAESVTVAAACAIALRVIPLIHQSRGAMAACH